MSYPVHSTRANDSVGGDSVIPWLYQQAANGDKQAENELIIQIMPKLRIQLQRIIWEQDVLDDVIQDTLLACLIKVRQKAIRSPKLFSAYAQAIGRNLACQYIRKHKKDQSVIQFNDTESQSVAMQDIRENPDIKVEKMQTEKFVSSMLNQLPRQRDQEILSSYYLEEHHSNDICIQHNIQKDHLYRVLCRARKRLGQLINKQLFNNNSLKISYRSSQ